MKQRGKKSAASKAAKIVAHERPAAPPHLRPEIAAVWDQVVRALPHDWFNDTNTSLLEAYCSHIVTFRRLQKTIDQMESEGVEDLKTYKLVLSMRDKEGRALSSLATRMRLSQQASYDKQKSKNTTSGPKPWEVVSE